MKNENIIIICSDSNKKAILRKLSEAHRLLRIKFFNFDELKRKLIFDYDNKTLEYIMINYQVPLELAKIYIKNMYYLKDLDEEKVQFLNKLKRELEENKLLKITSNFITYIKKQKVIVYGSSFLSLEEQKILEGIPYELKYEHKSFIPRVLEAKNISEEVEYVVNEISELLYQNINIDNIKIIAGNEYSKTLKYYFSLYKIPLAIESENSFYSTLIAKEFLNSYDELSIKDNIEKLKEKYQDIGDLITIINRSVLVRDKKTRKSFIIDDLKKAKIKSIRYEKSIEVCDLYDCFNDNDYVFLLGFNINSIPKIIKDDDYLKDEIKAKLQIDTSVEKNILANNKIIESIKNINHLTITYKLYGENGPNYPSFLLDLLDINIEKIKLDYHVIYSKLNSELKYAKDLDDLYKFNTVNDSLILLHNNLDIPYKKYNNTFKGINKLKLQEQLKEGLSLSYTSLEMFYECSFHYYLSNILGLNIYSNSFKSIVGSITHHILELGITKEISIETEIIKFVKDNDYELTSKELFYLELLAKELEFVLKYLKEKENESKLKEYLFENELYVYKDYNDINITFKGFIDKVMYTTYNGKEVLAVVDYKTGNKSISLDTLEYGLNLQLPIYLYLLKKSERFKDSIIAGFYLEKVLSGVMPINHKKSIEEVKKENLRLQGFSNSDEKILELLDENYLDSKMIKGLRFKKDGSLYSGAKVLSQEEMEDLISVVDNKIEEGLASIMNGEFVINPKVVKGKNVSCTYCKFKDICYHTKNDEVILGGEKDELDGRTSISN